MKLLFIGESWRGSCARSFREALARRNDIELDDISEDVWFPKPRARWLRAINRFTREAYRRELNAEILTRLREFRPDVVVTYKGSSIHSDLLSQLNEKSVPTVNIYPDCSPHAHGESHREAVGKYDLVISTKPYHPEAWLESYGYRNDCVFVPQGYDPSLHLATEAPVEFEFDLVMVATYRPEYGKLMSDLAKAIEGKKLRVAIGGYGWNAISRNLPPDWIFPGPIHGRSYVSLLRKGKICIAPLTRDVIIDGRPQNGDVDTTRTYELAAAHCFFVHRRTEYVMGIYDQSEVPMFNDAAELALHIDYYLANESQREKMAAAAHERAVPNYSIDARVDQVVRLLKKRWGDRA